MTDATATIETVVTAAAPAVKIKTLADVQAFVVGLIGAQNEITVVSSDIEDVRDGGKILGKRVRLVLTGAGVGDPTRRYFLRENSAFATAIEKSVVIMAAPKKERNSDQYILFFGLNEAAVSYKAPAPEKAKKELMTPEQRKQARLDGKARKRAEREAAAAAKAEAEPAIVAEDEVEVNVELESAESIEVEADDQEIESAETVAIDSDEPVVLA
jgi:hypothetical protein